MEKDNKSKKIENVERIIMFVGILVAAYCVMNTIIPGVIAGVALIALAVALAERRIRKNKKKDE